MTPRWAAKANTSVGQIRDGRDVRRRRRIWCRTPPQNPPPCCLCPPRVSACADPTRTRLSCGDAPSNWPWPAPLSSGPSGKANANTSYTSVKRRSTASGMAGTQIFNVFHRAVHLVRRLVNGHFDARRGRSGQRTGVDVTAESMPRDSPPSRPCQSVPNRPEARRRCAVQRRQEQVECAMGRQRPQGATRRPNGEPQGSEDHPDRQRQKAVVPEHLGGQWSIFCKPRHPEPSTLTTFWSLWVENKLLL